MGKANEGDKLRELQDYFEQMANLKDSTSDAWRHAGEMCRATLEDMGATDTGPLASIYTRIIGELASIANNAAKSENERLQRALKQSNADEHAALSAVDRLRGELKSVKESLQVSCDATSRLERQLADIKRAARLTDGELEALAEVNRNRGGWGPVSSALALAGFAGRVRSVLEPHIIDAMPDETLLTEQPAAPGPSQRLKAVEQEQKFLWSVVRTMAEGNFNRAASMARVAVKAAEQARKERGC